MIFFNAALRLGASEARSRTKLGCDAAESRSASCSNSRSWEAILGPVVMKPAVILPLNVGS
jgi:hypothetical protein